LECKYQERENDMALKELNLNGKTAIVTGAGRGIGKAIALTMAEAGADVVVAARTKSQIEETAAEVRQLGRKSLAIPTDVGQTEQVEKLVEATIAEFGKVDIMVANAGLDILKPLLLVEGLPPMRGSARLAAALKENLTGLTEQEWDATVNINLNGVVRCARAVGPHMIKQRRGKIINISSINGFRSGANDVSYSTAKAAVQRFTQALALEWAPFNINVNAIAPGAFPTEMWQHPEWGNIPDEEKATSIENIPDRVPLGRWGDLRELGLLAVFLASDGSNYITGEIITCDGGVLL